MMLSVIDVEWVSKESLAKGSGRSNQNENEGRRRLSEDSKGGGVVNV